MVYVEYLIKILIYFVFAALCYQFARKSRRISEDGGGGKITLCKAFLLCSLMGGYAVICGQKPYYSDRENYAFRFASDGWANWVKEDSIGLYLFEKVLHVFTYHPDVLFFAVAFTVLALTIWAYNLYGEREPYGMLLLTMSLYCLYSTFLLKQMFAVAIGNLAVVLFCQKKYVRTCLFVCLACCFHESSFILIPLLLGMRFSNYKSVRLLEYMALIVGIFFFTPLSRVVCAWLIQVFPAFETQISTYLDASGSITGSGLHLATVFKGIPVFAISIYGVLYRKRLKCMIENYHMWMIMSIFCSMTYMLSAYMYWMWRFGCFCYFFVFMYAAQMIKAKACLHYRYLFKWIVSGTLGLLLLKELVQFYFLYGGI